MAYGTDSNWPALHRLVAADVGTFEPRFWAPYAGSYGTAVVRVTAVRGSGAQRSFECRGAGRLDLGRGGVLGLASARP